MPSSEGVGVIRSPGLDLLGGNILSSLGCPNRDLLGGNILHSSSGSSRADDPRRDLLAGNIFLHCGGRGRIFSGFWGVKGDGGKIEMQIPSEREEGGGGRRVTYM